MSFSHVVVFGCFSWLLTPATARGASLPEQIDEIHRLETRIAAGERGLVVRAAQLKEAAVQRALATYGIDTRAVTAGVHYSPQGNMRDREGATLVDRDGTLRVLVGDGAFRSAAWLGSSIAHEVEVHVNRQIAQGRYARGGDETSAAIEEIEAYDHELASDRRFGLDASERRSLAARRAAFYRALGYGDQKRVDAGVYVKRR
jgi:hypothetical protein